MADHECSKNCGRKLVLNPFEDESDLSINGYRLEMTSCACPEQYNVFKDNIQVGYLRLRHGHFRADVPDCGGETVYSAFTAGDGVFDDTERMPQLTAAIQAIDAYTAKMGEK